MLVQAIFSCFSVFAVLSIFMAIVDTSTNAIGNQRLDVAKNSVTQMTRKRQRFPKTSPRGRRKQQSMVKKKLLKGKQQKDNYNTKQATTASQQERLYGRLIYGSKLPRPDLTAIPQNVTIRIMLIKVQKLIEQSEIIVTTVRIQIGWQDRRLKWNISEFGGIKEILMPAHSVWKPDLAVINSVGDIYSVVRDARFEVKVIHNGQVWWHPTGVLTTFCRLQLSYFPYDRQKCPIIIESPTFDYRFLYLYLRQNRTPVDVRMYVKSGSWDLVKTFGTSQLMKVGAKTYFSRIEFWIILERTRLYHSINFILPSFILSAIQTVFCFLPATHPQRVGSTTVTMLSVMVFQNMIVAQLPKTSESVPLLSIYIDLVIFVSATSVCASVFTALCQFNADQMKPIPNWLRFCCLGFFRNHRKNPTNRKQSLAQIDSREKNQRRSSPSSRQTHQPVSKRRLSRTDRPPQQHLALHDQRSVHVNVKDQTGQDTCSDEESNKEEITEVNAIFRSAVRRSMSARRQTFSTEWDRMSSAFDLQQTVKKAQENSGQLTWFDILKFIDHALNWACFLAITLGPIVIFGIVPNLVEHQDYPEPVGHNFVLQKGTVS